MSASIRAWLVPGTVLLAGCVALTTWALNRNAYRETPETARWAEGGAREADAEDRDLTAAESLPEEARSSTPKPDSPSPKQVPVGEFLEEYWGAEWPEVRARLEARGRDLDMPFHIEPWESVEEEIYSQLLFEGLPGQQQIEAWIDSPQPLTAQVLIDRYEFEPPVLDWELAEMQVVVEDFDDRLRLLAEECLAAVNQAVGDKIAAGQMDRAPFSTSSLDRGSPRGNLVGRAGASGGWAVTVHLRAEDCPRMVELKQELKQLRNERSRALLRRGRSR